MHTCALLRVAIVSDQMLALLFDRVGRFVPLPVLGSFICAIGLELLIEQTWHMRHKVTTEELLEIVFLLFVMIFSFVGGFALGMFMALVAFTAKYTSTPVIKSILNGDEYQGSATRSKETRAFLHRYASEIITLRLQGFIFFFTAEKLRKSVIGVYESLMDDVRILFSTPFLTSSPLACAYVLFARCLRPGLNPFRVHAGQAREHDDPGLPHGRVRGRHRCQEAQEALALHRPCGPEDLLHEPDGEDEGNVCRRRIGE